MSIIGDTYCAVSTGSLYVDFVNSTMIPDILISDYLIHQSVFTGNKIYFNLKDYCSFEVNVNLFKYSDKKSKFNELYNLKDKKLYFYPHSGSDAIKDIYSQPVEFIMTKFEPYYLTDIDFYDLIKIEFSSTKYHYFGTVTSLGYGYSYGQSYGIGF